MRKIYLLKTFLLACLFSIVGGGMAWADGSDDFVESFTKGDTSYGTRKSNAGWVCTNAALLSIDGTIAPTINGKTTAVGDITSPTLRGGCGTLTFKYANTYSESKGVSVNVTVTDASGKEVKTDIVNKSVTQNHVYTATIENINVAGDFTIKIKNNSPTNSSEDNKDRVSIWNIQWTGYSAGDETLEPAGFSFGDPAPTVDADLYKPMEFTTPKLTNPNSLTVTYASSNEDVATVDANTGVVTLMGVGSTTITASSVKTETYAAGSASYTLNVTDSSPYFRFAQTVYSVMINTAFTAPTVETNVEGTPTYSSSVPSVATVDSETGAVTLVAPGTTTITATLDTHSASYTLTVTPLPATVFAPVTAQSEVVAGATYIVLNKDGDKAMGEQASGKKYMLAVDVTLDNGLYTGAVDAEGLPYAFQLVASGNDFKIQQGNTYLTSTNTSKSDISWEASVTDGAGLWQIDMSTKNSSPIINQKAKRQLGYNYNNGTIPRFATYAKTSSSYSAVLYRQYSASDLTLTIRDAGYATYYSDKAFVVPAGMEATTVTAANNDGTLTMAWEYQAGSIVPAETAVLLRGEAATYNAIQLTDCTVAAPEGNLLHGSTIDAETEGGAKYYKLTYGTIDGQRKFGFFWGAANGAAFTNAAGKAYLAVPAEIAATGFRLDGMDATGIGQVEVGSQHANAAYSLSGVRVDSSKPLPAGAYIINGRKVIVK